MFTQTDLKAFGTRLKDLLKEQKMTRVKLALEMHVSELTIDKYCRGQNPPSFDNMKLLAQILKVSTDYLYGLTTIRSGEISADVVLDEVLKNFCEMIKEKYSRTMRLLDRTDEILRLQILRCRAGEEEGVFPRDDDVETVLRSFGEHRGAYIDKYCFHKNIYRDTDNFEDYSALDKMYGSDIAMYDYINAGHGIDDLKKVYERERYSLGEIGAFSADEFYWLNYVLGYFTKDMRN